MTQDIDDDVYSKNHKVIYTYISWLNGVIKRHKKFRIDIKNLSNYFEDIVGDPEVMYQSIKNTLSNEGIIVSNGTDYYGTEFLTFSFDETGAVDNGGTDVKILNNKGEEISLENNKLYNEETKCLICPECHHYSVEFSSPSEKWWCSYCIDNVNFHNYGLEVSDKDKYHIYKLWGAEALSAFTNESMKKTIKFVASYFRSCCMSKKDKCLYFDFFKDKEKEGEKEDKIVEIEGDVIDERSEMGIVRRNERSKQSGIVKSSQLERRKSDR